MEIKNQGWLYCTAIFVLVLDFITKTLVRSLMQAGDSAKILPFLSITHTQNTGIAFGLLQAEALRWVFVFIALAVAVVIVWSVQQKRLRRDFVLWGLVIGGALGNALDRILLGAVTDFIDLHWWPAFNLADSALTIGVVLLVLHEARKK
jgi:signal peptidase II